MSKFKIGDKVRVIKNNHNGNVIGTILTVAKNIDGYCEFASDGNRCVYFKETYIFNTEEELELVERIRKEYKVGDRIIFKVKDNHYTYSVETIYLNNVNGSNQDIFRALSIVDCFAFCENVYGYTSRNHDGNGFPEYHEDDMIACNKIINALLDMCDDYEDTTVRIKKVEIKYTNLF